MSDTIEAVPISNLELLKTNLEGMQGAGYELLSSLEKAKTKPHVLDDATVSRMKQVYLDQQAELKNYQHALAQWSADNPSQKQQEKLKGFGDAIRAVRVPCPVPRN